MAIQAKRFDFLNQETNIGVSNYINVDDSNLRGKGGRTDTSAEGDSLDVAKEQVADKLTELMTPIDKAMKEGMDNVAESIKDAIKGMTPDIDLGEFDLKKLFRQSKDILGVMGDMAKMPGKLLDSMLGGLFPGNPTAKGLAKDVFKVCDSLGSGLGNMKPFDASIDCNGKNLKGSAGNCKPKGISNLLDAVTGGSYSKGTKDINAAVNSAVALATSSYKANMCGGFSTAKGGLNGNKSAINRAGAMVMAALGGKHNVRGMLDVLKDSDGFDIKKQLPKAVKNLLGNPMNKAKEYGKNGINKIMSQFGGDTRDAKGVYLGIKDGASLLDEKWDTNEEGIQTLAKVTDNDLTKVKGNVGFKGLAKNKLSNNPLSLGSLNNVNTDTSDSLALAYTAYA